MTMGQVWMQLEAEREYFLNQGALPETAKSPFNR